MFGYVHISPDKLSEEEKERYQACYCGLCHTLGRRYGTFARMILNYDLVFLAVLLSGGSAPECARRGARCIPSIRAAPAKARRRWRWRQM